jgi:hypothetical protein
VCGEARNCTGRLVSEDRGAESVKRADMLSTRRPPGLRSPRSFTYAGRRCSGGQGGEEMDGNDAVELLRRGRSRDRGGEVGVVDVGADAVDLCGRVTVGSDRKPLLLEHERNVLPDETSNRIDRDAEPDAHLLLRSSDEATTASTDVEDALAGLQLRERQRQRGVRMMDVAGVVVAADHIAKGAVDLGRSAVVDHGGDGGAGGADNEDGRGCQCRDKIELAMICC